MTAIRQRKGAYQRGAKEANKASRKKIPERGREWFRLEMPK